MGMLNHFLYPWGWILVGVALLHFIRRRPDTYWIYIILFLGPVGSLVYLLVEAAPDLGLLRGSFKAFPRRRRIAELRSLVAANPSSGNYEELGDLLKDDGKFAAARDAFAHAIAARADGVDPFYQRGVCSVRLGDALAAVPDLEYTVSKDPRYDFDRAAGLLAHAYAQTGRQGEAEALFNEVTARSVSSETYLNFAELLAAQGRRAEARQWAQRVLDKKAAMPGYLRRRERPMFWRARKLLTQNPA